jgi:hypothetical protein
VRQVLSLPALLAQKAQILTRAGGAAHGGQRAAAVQRLLVGTAVRREAAAIEVMDAWADYLAEEQAERADAYERAKEEQVLSLTRFTGTKSTRSKQREPTRMRAQRTSRCSVYSLYWHQKYTY